MRLLGSQVFKSNNCIEDKHTDCALGFTCECGCHYPTILSKPNHDYGTIAEQAWELGEEG